MISSVIFQDQTHAMTQLSSQPSTEHPEINWRPKYNPLIVHLPLFFVDLWIFRIEELPIQHQNLMIYLIQFHIMMPQTKLNERIPIPTPSKSSSPNQILHLTMAQLACTWRIPMDVVTENPWRPQGCHDRPRPLVAFRNLGNFSSRRRRAFDRFKTSSSTAARWWEWWWLLSFVVCGSWLSFLLLVVVVGVVVVVCGCGLLLL